MFICVCSIVYRIVKIYVIIIFSLLCDRPIIIHHRLYISETR